MKVSHRRRRRTITLTSTKTNNNSIPRNWSVLFCLIGQKKIKIERRFLPRFELGSLDSESRVLTITPWNLTNNSKEKSVTNFSHSSTEGRQSLCELKVVENEKQKEEEQGKTTIRTTVKHNKLYEVAKWKKNDKHISCCLIGYARSSKTRV